MKNIDEYNDMIEKTIEIMNIDPIPAINYMGTFCEQIVNDILLIEGMQEHIDNEQFEKINILFEKQITSEQIHADLHDIRISRNRASHYNVGNIKTACQILALAEGILCWFKKKYTPIHGDSCSSKISELIDQNVVDQISTMFNNNPTFESAPIQDLNVSCSTFEYEKHVTIQDDKLSRDSMTNKVMSSWFANQVLNDSIFSVGDKNQFYECMDRNLEFIHEMREYEIEIEKAFEGESTCSEYIMVTHLSDLKSNPDCYDLNVKMPDFRKISYNIGLSYLLINLLHFQAEIPEKLLNTFGLKLRRYQYEFLDICKLIYQKKQILHTDTYFENVTFFLNRYRNVKRFHGFILFYSRNCIILENDKFYGQMVHSLQKDKTYNVKDEIPDVMERAFKNPVNYKPEIMVKITDQNGDNICALEEFEVTNYDEVTDNKEEALSPNKNHQSMVIIALCVIIIGIIAIFSRNNFQYSQNANQTQVTSETHEKIQSEHLETFDFHGNPIEVYVNTYDYYYLSYLDSDYEDLAKYRHPNRYFIAISKVNALNMRAESNTNARVVEVLSQNDAIEVYGKQGDWYFGRLINESEDLRIGWCHSDYMSFHIETDRVSTPIKIDP